MKSMLPAKFSGFASRVGRLALRALSWHKTSERDAALSATSGATSGATVSDSYSNSDASNSVCNFADSDSSFRTARPARTFRRAILAFFVAAATLFVTFVVPAKPASAAQVWWDYLGNGYVSADSNYVGNAVQNMRIDPPKIDWDVRPIKVTYDIWFNLTALENYQMRHQSFFDKKKLHRQVFVARPYFYVFTPSGLDNSSIRIKRSVFKHVIGNTTGKQKYYWEDQDSVEDIKRYDAGGTRWAHPFGQEGFQKDWENSVGDDAWYGCGPGSTGDYADKYSKCEINKWKSSGKFGYSFTSYERGNAEWAYHWTITANVKEGQDPRYLPLIAGYDSTKRINHSHERHYTVFGPYDTDGDGVPDYVEWDNGTNPLASNDFKHEPVDDGMYGETSTARSYFPTGSWEGDSSKGEFVYNKTPDGKDVPSYDIPKGMQFSVDSSKTTLDGQKTSIDIGQGDTTPNLAPGKAWLNTKTGNLSFNPPKIQWKDYTKPKVYKFYVKSVHPDAIKNEYNCNKQQVTDYNEVKFTVWPMSHYFKPIYDNVRVEAGKTVNTNKPYNVGLKKLQGREFPEHTKFEVKEYNRSPKPKSWASVDKNNEETGVVTLRPGKDTGEYEGDVPVLVTYPDGSTSANHEYSTSEKKYAYTHVQVVPVAVGNNDLHLNVHDGNNLYNLGANINNNSLLNHFKFTSGESIKKTEVDSTGKVTTTSEGVLLDSWATNGSGKISLRAICYERDKYGREKNGTAHAGGINGLTIGDTKQWLRADAKEQQKCDKGQCNRNDYLYKDDVNSGTMERSRAVISGTPSKPGDFSCKVYAVRENKIESFDIAVGLFGQGLTSHSMPDDPSGVYWVSKTFNFKVYSQAHIYNPSYVPLGNVKAGAFDSKNNVTSVPKSVKGANGATSNQNYVKGDSNNPASLPKGTWFEFKQYKNSAGKHVGDAPLDWAYWDPEDQSNAAKKQDAEYGKVTFRPTRWTDAGTYNQPVIVHYPDGSTSESPDAGNQGKPVYAKVTVNVDTPVKGDLSLGVWSKQYNRQTGVGGSLIDDEHNKKGILLEKDKPVDPYMWVDSWSKNKPGYIYQRILCYKKNPKTGKPVGDSYEVGGINGLKLGGKEKDSSPKQFIHATPSMQKDCRTDKKNCDSDNYLYDSDNTMERTWGWISGTPENNGDFVCTIYAFKNGLDSSFDQQVGKFATGYVEDQRNRSAISSDNKEKKADKKSNKKQKVAKASERGAESATSAGDSSSTPSSTPASSNLKLVVPSGKDYINPTFDLSTRGIDWESNVINIHIHNKSHYYNPKYVDASVKAGNAVTTGVPSSVKYKVDNNTAAKTGSNTVSADSPLDKDIVAGALPDGTWFEFKDAANGFEVNSNGTKGSKVSLDWSYWASNNTADKTGEQSNKPDNPSNQKKGKHSANGDGARYGKVTFHPDQSVAPKSYLKEIVIHYPDGSTSDDPDSGNNGKPVYAKVTVGGLGGGADRDLKMTLLRSQDADSTDTLGGGNSLTVMSGTSLTKNPYVLAWSLKDRSNISLRMMCTKQGEQKWSRGLDDTLNMHLNQNYGESVKPWAFATAEQRKSCSENSKNCNANLLYGFTKNGKQDSIESAVSRSEDDIVGVPQKSGKYTCAVFALKPNALNVFNNTVNAGLSADKKYSSTDMKKVQLTGLNSAVDWNRIAVDVNVIDPPKFALPKTGGDGLSMAWLVLAMIGMCVMCGAFFVDQTKWGHAMLAGAAAGMMGGLRGIARGMTANITQARTTQANITQNSNSNSKISEIWRGLVKKVKNIRRFDDYSAPAKDFVRKATGWLRAAFRRVGRWATERWRC